MAYARSLSRFLRRQDGSLIVEGVIILPLLLWAVMAMFALWDVFRTQNVLQKATYTVSDVISRTKKDVALGPVDISGFYDLLNFLLPQAEELDMRITNITYDEDDDEYLVLWSCAPGDGMIPLTDATLAALRDRIPAMPNADTVTIVESRLHYETLFDIGLDPIDFEQFVVTRPRLAPVIVLSSCS